MRPSDRVWLPEVPMKIADIRDARTFQRLVHRLLVAERGADFHIPDDSGGDRGNDGYDADRRTLYAIYCPEKPDTADYRRKALSDLRKAGALATERGYSITRWVFVTPTPLREPLQAELRALAADFGLTVGFLADAHLEDLLRKHPHIRDEVPTLEYPQVARQLEAIRAPLTPLRAFFTLESEVSDEDLARVFSKHTGYRRYSADLPLPDPPDGPPPGVTSCRLHQPDGFLDFSEGRLDGAGLLHLMGIEFPHIHRPASHTVCRISRSSLKGTVSSEPLCQQPEVLLEVAKDGDPNPREPHSTIAFRSPMAGAERVLRLCAIDNAVFADFLTDAMSPTPADASTWSLYDLGGARLRITLTFFYVDGLASLPESSWPRVQGMYLVVGDRYVISVPDEAIDQQRRGRAAHVKIASGAVAPTVELDYSIPLHDFVQGISQSSPRP
jgi:hypothetical protein